MATDRDSRDEEYQIRGSEGKQCQYEGCESESNSLVRFEETKPTVHIWMCGPHAGNSVQQHDDAEVVDDAY